MRAVRAVFCSVFRCAFIGPSSMASPPDAHVLRRPFITPLKATNGSRQRRVRQGGTNLHIAFHVHLAQAPALPQQKNPGTKHLLPTPCVDALPTRWRARGCGRESVKDPCPLPYLIAEAS